MRRVLYIRRRGTEGQRDSETKRETETEIEIFVNERSLFFPPEEVFWGILGLLSPLPFSSSYTFRGIRRSTADVPINVSVYVSACLCFPLYAAVSVSLLQRLP